jgi:predicted alpha/beta hydrolase
LRQKPNSHLLRPRKNNREIAVARATRDDVFTDDISLPATDGYLLGATLFLPRGAKRHAVLINSATAVPRKIYGGFASYLARRGCAVLTYDYRGIGGSRPKAPAGDGRPKSLVGFKASMSDWAALDVTAAVAWMRQRYQALPLAYVGHSFAGQALGLLANNSEVSRALLIAAQAGYWKLMASPERYRVYVLLNFVGRSPHPVAGLRARMGRPRRGSAEGRVSAMGRLGDAEALSVRRPRSHLAAQFRTIPRRHARAVLFRRSLGNPAGGRTAVLGVHGHHAGNPDHHSG